MELSGVYYLQKSIVNRLDEDPLKYPFPPIFRPETAPIVLHKYYIIVITEFLKEQIDIV